MSPQPKRKKRTASGDIENRTGQKSVLPKQLPHSGQPFRGPQALEVVHTRERVSVWLRSAQEPVVGAFIGIKATEQGPVAVVARNAVCHELSLSDIEHIAQVGGRLP